MKVLILCGGRGHRMRPLTARLPKPLVALNDKPVLEHIIEFYIRKGYHEFILCVGYRAETICRFVRTRKFDADIEISNSGARAGMLKRIYDARRLMGERAVVTYGDTFIDIDIDEMRKWHVSSSAEATITIADIRSPFGLVAFDAGNRVRSFEEKPLLQYYVGHMILERNALKGASAGMVAMPDGNGLISFFDLLTKKGKLYCYRHRGIQITFNTMYEHREAERTFTKFFTEQEGTG